MKERKEKKKEREKKKREGFAEKRGRNVESTVFRRVLSESFVFSRGKHAQVCLSSPRWKSALLPWRDRREKKRRYPRFISKRDS